LLQANSFAKDLLQNYIEEYDTNDAVKKITDDFQQKVNTFAFVFYVFFMSRLRFAYMADI